MSSLPFFQSEQSTNSDNLSVNSAQPTTRQGFFRKYRKMRRDKKTAVSMTNLNISSWSSPFTCHHSRVQSVYLSYNNEANLLYCNWHLRGGSETIEDYVHSNSDCSTMSVNETIPSLIQSIQSQVDGGNEMGYLMDGNGKWGKRWDSEMGRDWMHSLPLRACHPAYGEDPPSFFLIPPFPPFFVRNPF